MSSLDVAQLLGKLNSVCWSTLENAVGMCVQRTNHTMEIEHWFLKLIEVNDSDMYRVLADAGVDLARVSRDLTARLDQFKRGNVDTPTLSERTIGLIRSAWMLGSINYGAQKIRSCHLLEALLTDDVFYQLVSAIDEFRRIDLQRLRKNLPDVLTQSREMPPTETQTANDSPLPPAKETALAAFAVDMTDQARSGLIDPVIGREREIRQLIDILLRRRQNNPILIGDAGVGKTAVVEGLALRIAGGDVPDVLRSTRLLALDLGSLQAGASVRGEFERRLKAVIDEVKASPAPVILFIDEAHNLMGAGAAAGQGDAANLLKPALARGELRTIAATTWMEYTKYFETDAALSRPFQVVKVDEPDIETAVMMMQGLVPTLERHHRVRLLPEAVEASVKLSARYVMGRQLPDKCVSILDTTCARIALSQSSTPAQLEDCRQQLSALRLSKDILQREALTGADCQGAIDEVEHKLLERESQLKDLEGRWQVERELVLQIIAAREKLAGDIGQIRTTSELDMSAETRTGLLSELSTAAAELQKIQGDRPMVHPVVTPFAVAETVESWTGIPLGRMMSDDLKIVLSLKSLMEEAVVGQSHALEIIADSIPTSRAGINDPGKPIGVFLLYGPSGVGKTETAVALAELLYGGQQNMTVINMSEYKEEYRVSQLVGPPPGYKGYEEGGVLTEAVRRKPYSVILLDEIEKAHPSLQEVFYQVFDKGTLRDGKGRDIDFKNTVIFMATNAGSEEIKVLCNDPDTAPSPEKLGEALYPRLIETFKPAFLGRVTRIPYYPLTDKTLAQIVRLKLDRVRTRIATNIKAVFRYSDDVVQQIVDRCTEVDTGARNVDHILNRTMLPDLSKKFLSGAADGTGPKEVAVGVGQTGDFEYVLK